MQRFLVVRVAGREYAVPAEHVLAMTRARSLALAAVENARPLRYRAHIDGSTVNIVVPHELLRLPPRPIGARSCVLFLDQGSSAILVDSVSRFEEVPADSIRNGTEVRLGEKWRPILDLDEIYSAIAA
jgi:chemotaxis protein histidine kinase CheA